MISQNLERILNRLQPHVALCAVSKFKQIEEIREAYDAGQRIFAESRPLEMKDKYNAMPKDIKWHFIGHLQTNKIKYIVNFVDLIHSIDSIKLLEAVNENASKIDRVVDILLEVFVAQEDTKQGLSPFEIIELYKSGYLTNLKNVNIVGLMAMATFTDNKNMISGEFKQVRALYDDLNSHHNANLRTLSMGMSSDYDLAIEQGSNLVRIGSSIFGSR